MATFSDDFNRADGGVGANYDNVNSGLVVFSNQARGSNTGTINYSTVKVATADFTDDHESQVTVATISGDDYGGPMVRSAGTTANSYILYTDGGSSDPRRLAKVVSGTRTTIGAVNVACVNGDVLKLRCVGTTLTWYKNGTLMETITDSTHTTGQPGLCYFFGNGNTSRLDSFSADDVSAASAIARISSGYHTRNINR
jgi:hypothetical protein